MYNNHNAPRKRWAKPRRASRILKEFITEVLAGLNSNPSTDSGGGNPLYTTGRDDADSGVRPGAGKNVNADSEDDAQAANQDAHAAACCLILNDDGEVLAVSRKDAPDQFGLPGGKIEPGGETPEQAAARELQEETGLTAKSLHQVFVRTDGDGFVTHTFACEPEGQIDTDEAGVVRWVHPEVLFNGPFGDYNRELWAHLGLPTGE
jgi:8-oxo-dGTP pyrophosphatase MutT (NUDIX family)